ncbi:hypothetical protein [Actinophytocola sp. KF-1]
MDHYKTVFGDGRTMATDEGAQGQHLRDGADEAWRQVQGMGDFWEGGFEEAQMVAQQDHRLNHDQADTHDAMSRALHQSVDIAQDALQRVRGFFA